ncbi:hypothetical protein [Streptomyces gobiensis]|uniref:hypothetical protein n=1 Tax=Streptomyces gobiensis TaxID=2875706 RepID=UPI001E383AD2|nr:hypothetical protein [Streptomyces gobiensis]UGY92477.1 hypothetical protein test1122_12615 [Streptomyces gobiensis]
MARRPFAAGAAALLLALGAADYGAAAAEGPGEPVPRIDLRVLVLDNGGPATAAIRARLDGSGTPYTAVDLTDRARERIDADFLTATDTTDTDSTDGGRPHARFQSVVTPDEQPAGLGGAEADALADYRARFDIPQVNAYVYPSPAVGLNWPEEPGYTGPLDGVTAKLTKAGRAGPFGYLSGTVPFDDLDPETSESYGALAVPLADPPEGSEYTSLLDAPIPGDGTDGSLIGEYEHDGLRDLVVNFGYNQHQAQFRLLARGIVDWLTDGVRLGMSRNYFAVHVDDVFAPDDRWDTQHNCTPGDHDCGAEGPGQQPSPIRMTAADARYAARWQRNHGFTLDMVYNAGSGEMWKRQNGGRDPLTDQLVADRDAFRWINHTYTHPYLGCLQDVSVVPWRCATDADGNTRWTSRSTITAEIQRNLDWAATHGLPVDRTELVTGEHSGLRTLPQQPDDNPNLGPALRDTGVRWIASDNSREPRQRTVGPARTVPRHPMSLFYNVGTAAELVDEYNWIYTSKADGGSGSCETDPAATCLPAPLDPDTGFTGHIAPLEARTALTHVLAGDPRPHYIHQSNLAEDRLAYPVLKRVLDDYRKLHADNTPLISPRQRETGTELRRRAQWQQALAAGQITAYRIGDTITVQTAAGANARAIPATAPTGTTTTGPDGGTTPFGAAYANNRSGWTTPDRPGTTLTLNLPH